MKTKTTSQKLVSDNSVHSTKVSSLAPHPQLLVCGAKSNSVGTVPASYSAWHLALRSLPARLQKLCKPGSVKMEQNDGAEVAKI